MVDGDEEEFEVDHRGAEDGDGLNWDSFVFHHVSKYYKFLHLYLSLV